ncbi:mucin-2-like [Episyrphus balteatus]|uniref:mucin-2-like n=1 Tax=Episyrphus balteatus TaxID=286459 RepID=UPI002486C453|nr:mucin-2-like [Episyrphus balteatus]
MSIRVDVILVLVLIGLSCAAELDQPRDVERRKCLDNTFYAKYVCKSHRNGEKFPVPGSCSEFYECFRGESIKRTCSKFFDFKLQKCVLYAVKCIEIDEKDCVRPTTPQPCSTVTPAPPVTCVCPTTPPPVTCPSVTCPYRTCSTVYHCTCPPTVTCPTARPCPTRPPTSTTIATTV